MANQLQHVRRYVYRDDPARDFDVIGEVPTVANVEDIAIANDRIDELGNLIVQRRPGASRGLVFIRDLIEVVAVDRRHSLRPLWRPRLAYPFPR